MYMCAHFLKIIRDYYSNIRKFALHVHFKTSVNVPSNEMFDELQFRTRMLTAIFKI